MFLPLMFAVDKARSAHSRRRPCRGSCFLDLCRGASPPPVEWIQDCGGSSSGDRGRYATCNRYTESRERELVA